MASMVEKISRALCIEESQDPDKMFGGGPGWKVYEHLALAAIKEMSKETWDWWYGEMKGKPTPEQFAEWLASLKEVEE